MYFFAVTPPNFLLFVSLLVAPFQTSPEFGKAFQEGLRSLEKGKSAEAIRALQRARALDPKNPAVHFNLGRAFALDSNFLEAVPRFRQAIELAPRDAESYLQLAVLQARFQRFQEAGTTLDDLLKVLPDHPGALLLSGRISAEQGDLDRAEKRLRRYVDLRPRDAKGLAELGVVLLTQLREKEAEGLLLKALEGDPDLGNARYNLGVAYARRGDHQLALPHLQAAIRLLQSGEAYFQYGKALLQLGELEEAESALRQAVQLRPESSEALYSLSIVLRRQGRAEEADTVLDRHRQLSARASNRHQANRIVSRLHSEVKALLEQNRISEAEAKLRSILESDPVNDLAFYRLGQISFLRRDYGSALEEASKARRLKIQEPSYTFLEAMCLERLQRDSEASDAYRRVLGVLEYSPAHSALARLALKQGRLEEGLSHLARAVELEPDNPDLRLAYAQVLQRAGRLTESKEQRDKAGRLRNRSKP